MRNLLVEIAYQGHRYHGYQVQKNALAVAEVLQDAIESVIGVREPITGCSRTDTGVHAHRYYFHMHTQNPIPTDRFVRAMNHALPGDIAVFRCVEVPDTFHARYDCVGKEYHYRIWNTHQKNPFLDRLAWHYPYPLDLPLLQEAANQMVGQHDFRSFCAAGGSIIDTTRTIHHCTVLPRETHEVLISVAGDGFLYHMVRIMVGTLLAVAEGKFSAGDITGIIQAKDRTRAGRTAPPDGLYLHRVDYRRNWFEQASE